VSGCQKAASFVALAGSHGAIKMADSVNHRATSRT
jgi:hypothetical protein